MRIRKTRPRGRDTDREKSMRSYVAAKRDDARRNGLVRDYEGFSRSKLPGFTETEIFSSHVPIQTGIGKMVGVQMIGAACVAASF
jgi:hypothetical protein